MKNLLLSSLVLVLGSSLSAQVLGGGQFFSNAVAFNSIWTENCAASGTTLSNQAAFEPNLPMDPCGAPAPINVTGSTASDVWFSFFPNTNSVTIKVNPSASFDVGIQAFTGSSCGTLVEIGSVDAGGNNATETLILNSLAENVRYTFRIYGATNSVASRTGTYNFCGSEGLLGTPLPVEISSFTARQYQGKVELRWITSSEKDNAYFEIERASDGIQFEAIGKVAGQGNSSVATSYKFEDTAPLSEMGYYRLRQVDFSGQTSMMAHVQISGTVRAASKLTVAPNPVKGRLHFRIGVESSENVMISILDLEGRILHEETRQAFEGENAVEIDAVQGLAPGIYTLRLRQASGIQHARFILQE